jgi:hypothetical protein
VGIPCDFITDCAAPAGKSPGDPSGPYKYLFVDVDGYKDEPLFFHMNFQSLIGANKLYFPNIFACDAGKGTFYISKENDGTICTADGVCGNCGDGSCYDANGKILDRPRLESHLITSISSKCHAFVDGAVATLPTSDRSRNGYYMKFVPNPGESGTDYNRLTVVLDNSFNLTAATQCVEPTTVVTFFFNIHPYASPAATGAP